MAGIDVHDHVGKVQALESIGHTLLVGTLAVLASCQIGVGDEIGEGIRLDQKRKGRVGMGLEDLDNG